MKKNIFTYLVVLIILTVLISLFFLFGGKNEITDTKEISKIVSDSKLELIHNLGNFSNEQHSYEKILQVAMLIASEKGYMNESTTNDYFEYVTKSDVHEIIKELTGMTIEAPIQIEGFYYQYDSENEYYYLRPSVPPLYKILNINKVYLDDNIYIIESTSTKTEDGKIIYDDNITTKLKFTDTNSYTKYQVIEQKIS